MKKLICTVLVLALVFACACGCTENEPDNNSSQQPPESAVVSFRDARKYTAGEGTPWTLNNTYYKLTHDKKLTVAYIGGSVTVGTGSTEDECWRAYTTKWFETNYPNAQIDHIDSGYGGTSSLWGLARLQSMIIDKNPDLVFVEFSINDLYNNISEDQSAALMDGIIHKINAQLPNTDIVLISVVDNQTVVSQSPNAKMHQAIAKYYGITWLDMGVPMNAALKATGKEWKDFASDSVHPNKEGYKIYGDYVAAMLSDQLGAVKGKNPSGLVPHELPSEPYTDNSALKAETVWAKDIPADPEIWETITCKTAKYGEKAIRGRKGATLTYEFSGAFIAMYGSFKGSKIDCYIDGQFKRCVGYSDEKGEVIVYDNLNPNEKHTLSITVNGTQAQITAFMMG